MPPALLALAATLCMALCALALRLFPRIGLMDRPHLYGLTRAPIPYFGGLVIYSTFLILALLFVPMSRELLGLLAGISLLTLTSFIDDAYRLPPLIRLLAQVAAGILLALSGVGVDHITNPFGGTIALTALTTSFTLFGYLYHLSLLGILFTVGWVVLLTNSMNWMDGVPGLCSGVAALAALTIFLLALRPDFHYFDQTSVSLIAAILAGSAGAFVAYNFPPPRILLGDTGSMLFGFILAALAIYSGGKIATAALVLGVPLVDALLVIIRRIALRRSPLRGDYSHLHHRLLAAGCTKPQAVLILYTASIAFGASALFITSSLGKLTALLILVLVMLLADLWLTKKGITGLPKDAG